MRMIKTENAQRLGEVAAERIAEAITACIAQKGGCRLVLSTGASQFTTLSALTQLPVDWKKVHMFHLDEYKDLSAEHPASFRRYLRERFVEKTSVGAVTFVDGTEEGLAALNEEARRAPLDIGLIGIGENGHIAFNDPPADFETDDPYIVVTLNDTCKRQQVREGWFPSVEETPRQAISMSVRQIMRIEKIYSCVPYASKNWAIRQFVERDETNMLPATILKRHVDFTLFVDAESGAGIDVDPAAHKIESLEAYEVL